jgi:hypothetical protein
MNYGNCKSNGNEQSTALWRLLFHNFVLMFFLFVFSVQFFCLRSYPLQLSPSVIGGSTDVSALLAKDPLLKSELPQTKSELPQTLYKIGIATWNLAEISVSLEDCVFLTDFEIKICYIIVLGFQECEHIRPRREEGSRSKKLKRLIEKTLSCASPSSYEILAVRKMGGMQLYCLVNKRAKELFSGVQFVEVPCGIGNVLSNKGGICLLLRSINNKTLAFISAHLAAHPHKVLPVVSFHVFFYSFER